MDFLKDRFIENFNMEIVARDLIDMIDEDVLFQYIIEEFNKNFTYGELYNIFNKYLDKKELAKCLEDLGHNYIDLDNLTDKEREMYY